MMEHAVHLSVMLVLNADLPSEKFLMRFFSEKLFAVQISTNLFLSNKKGFPVLSARHAQICKTFMKIQTRFVLSPRHPNDMIEKYYNYMAHLF
jgi:protein arginine N-methyltransferase 5